MSKKAVTKRPPKPPKPPPESPDLNRILPKKGETEPEKQHITSIRIRGDLLSKIAAIAKKQGYTRNETIVRLLEWACNAFFQEEMRNEADEKSKDVK